MFRPFLLVCLIYISISIANVTGEVNPFRYDYTYNDDLEGWLKYHHRPATFMDAFLHCNAEGAILASPLHENLQSVMEAAADKHGPIFTGIHALISKSDFTSIEGVPLDKIPLSWAPGDIGNQGECIIMLPNGSVANVMCNETHPFLCYRNDTTSPFNAECGTVDQEYKLNQQTGSCYKFHVAGRTWRRAQMTCLAEGGYLAIINSATEARVLKELFATKPASSIVSNFDYVAAVGFLDWDKKGSWFTVNGQTLEEAGFAGWSEGNPNNNKDIDDGQHCGGFFRWGTLDDIWCESVPFAFICEKTPDSLLSPLDQF